MDRKENRIRCIQCKYYGRNVCPLMADADVFQIEKCILEYEDIKSLREGTLDHFIFWRNPIEYLSYLGYKDKDNCPVVGETVLTLTGGFSSWYSGKFIQVKSENETMLFLSDRDGSYSVNKSEWWKKLFRIEKDSISK